MRGILIDHDVEGHFQRIQRCLNSHEWLGVWESFHLPVLRLHDAGLAVTTTDELVWSYCQRNQLILVTGNRSNDGPASLEATIRRENRSDSLPVLTIADPDEVIYNDGYAGEVAVRLLEILFDVNNLLGTGRLYLP